MMTINDTQALNTKNAGGQFKPTLPEHLHARRSDFKKQTVEAGISTATSIGIAVGCVLGMINAALAVMIAPFFVPGLNVLVADPATAALAGAALGSALGAVLGFLLEWCISSQKFKQLETSLGLIPGMDKS